MKLGMVRIVLNLKVKGVLKVRLLWWVRGKYLYCFIVLFYKE